MKTLITALITVATLLLINGCSSQDHVPRSFILNTCVFSVEKNAIPIMKKMEMIQKEASGKKEVEETYIMSLYVKADKNNNGKITEKEAQRAYDQYLTEIRVVLGALPFQVPTPEQ